MPTPIQLFEDEPLTITAGETDESRLREDQRRALESLRTADLGLPEAPPPTRALDVMAQATGEPAPVAPEARAPRRSFPAPVTVRGPGDPAAAARAQQIADMDPAEWARRRAAGQTEPGTDTPPASRAIAAAQQQNTAAAAPPATREDAIRAVADARQRGRSAQSVDPEIEAAKAQDPRLQAALDAAQADRTKARIGGILNSIFGTREAGFTRRLMSDSNRELDQYQQTRAQEVETEERARQQQRQAAEDERRRSLEDQRAQHAETALGQADRRISLSERDTESREMDAQRRMALMGQQSALFDAQRRATEGDARAQAEMQDPASGASRGAQDILLDAFREARGGEIPPSLEAAVRSQSASALSSNDAVRVALQGQYSTRRSTRQGGSDGGGNSINRAAQLAGRLRRAGYSEEQIEQQLGAQGLEAPESGTEILPGVRSGIQTGDPEVRALRDGFAAASSRADSITALNEITQRYGASASIDPRAEAAVAPHLMALRAMAADIQGTGVINPSEVETINSSLPNPRSLTGMTFGTLQEATSNWRRLLESKVAAGLRVRGVDDVGVQRALAALRAGGRFEPAQRRRDQSQPAGGDTVQMRAPDGSVRAVPRDRVDYYRQRGAELVD